MYKDEEKFKPIMREILIKIRTGENYKDLYTKYGEDDVHEALGRCIEMGEIPNAFARRNENGIYNIDL